MEVTDDIADQMLKLLEQINSGNTEAWTNAINKYDELIKQIDINDLYRKFEQGLYPELLNAYIIEEVNNSGYQKNDEDFSRFIFNLIVSGKFYSLPDGYSDYNDAVNIFVERVFIDPQTAHSYVFDNKFLTQAVNNIFDGDVNVLDLVTPRQLAHIAALIGSTITDDNIFSVEKKIYDFMTARGL